MEKFKGYIKKWINGEKVHGIDVSAYDVHECINVYNGIVRGEKPEFINGNVKTILDKCGIKANEHGIGWQVS